MNFYQQNDSPYLERSACRGTVNFHTRQDPSTDRPPPMICRLLEDIKKKNVMDYLLLAELAMRFWHGVYDFLKENIREKYELNCNFLLLIYFQRMYSVIELSYYLQCSDGLLNFII